MNTARGIPSRRVKQRPTLEVLILMLVCASCVFSQSKLGPSSQVKEITELEQQRAAAVVHRDTDFLDKSTAPDSIRILPTGVLETKSQLLGDLKSGVLNYSSIDVDEVSVKIYGNTAVVAGRSEFRGQRNGKPFDGRCRFSRIWINRNGAWQEVLFQLTPLWEP